VFSVTSTKFLLSGETLERDVKPWKGNKIAIQIHEMTINKSLRDPTCTFDLSSVCMPNFKISV